MAKRHNTPSKRLLPPSNESRRVRETDATIKRIEKVEGPTRKLKLTLMNGTRCTIAEDEEKYRHNNNFDIIWENLREGAQVTIRHVGMDILEVRERLRSLELFLKL